MKHITILSVFIVVAMQGYGQKKADMEAQVAQQSATIDSLNAQLSATNTALDSANMKLEDYGAMHQAIVDKVLKHDFLPADMGDIIDSLHTNRDSSFAASTEVWQDSVASLNAQIEKLNTASATEEQKVGMAEELKMLKGLLDEGILTEDEFNTRKTKVLDKWK